MRLVVWPPLLSIFVLLSVVGCGGGTGRTEFSGSMVKTAAQRHDTAFDTDPVCPDTGVASAELLGASSEKQRPEYWTGRLFNRADEPQLTPEDVVFHNQALWQRPTVDTGPWRLEVPLDRSWLRTQVDRRRTDMANRIETGKLVAATGRLPGNWRAGFEGEPLGETIPAARQFRVALASLLMRCGPLQQPLRSSDSVYYYDKNACGGIHPQEPFEVIGRTLGNQWLIRSRYTFGWIEADLDNSISVPNKWREAVLNEKSLFLPNAVDVRCADGRSVSLPAQVFVPRPGNKEVVVVATGDGFCSATVPQGAVDTNRPLTRRAFIETAFQFLGRPYGWGGQGGGVDCSRLVAEVLATFGLAMPRHSAWQSTAGSYYVDVSGITNPAQKKAVLEIAAQKGVVLLYFPGHIMIYLGQDGDGRPYALHALGEMARPCEHGSRETVYKVGKVVVTDLSVGLGSSRRSFLERLTRVVVLGSDSPPAQLAAISVIARPAPPQIPPKCEEGVKNRIFISPGHPVVGQPLRIVATNSDDPGAVLLRVWDPDGNVIPVEDQKLGGPPYSTIGSFSPSVRGRYKVVLGRAGHVVSCDEFSVFSWPVRPPSPIAEPRPFWKVRWKWEEDTENYFSAFVEHLFVGLSESSTTMGLTPLLSDPSRNLLYNHLGLGEDEELSLKPDCADLPYVLRAYFAWKNGLPFGVRSCSRGRPGHPPSCGELKTNLEPVPLSEQEQENPSAAFLRLANVTVGWSVHSASSRTHPRDEETDFYPVDLNRRSLAPGAVYTDPYGHVMMVVHHIPQPPFGTGVMLAADGQPDGTIGQRRFWPASFLFSPRTDSFGAGFKRFRPLVVERAPKLETPVLMDAGAPSPDKPVEPDRILVPLTNRELRKTRQFAPYSVSQYEGTKADFYRRVEEMINPQPRSLQQYIGERVEALYQMVLRRASAVERGEAYISEQGGATMEMPPDEDLFSTEGPWEDYSTPSRDMRLLIAMDTVLGIGQEWAASPGRFAGSSPDEMDKAQVTRMVQEALGARRFEYRNSALAPVSLSLLEFVGRRAALEMGYNPNDCPEIRFGAPAGSTEVATCGRRAPATQQARMEKLRPCFARRERPGQR